jgi:hypothetical protein
VLTHLTGPLDNHNGYANNPFKYFSDGVDGTCGSGASGNCGSILSFNIINFAGFAPATNQFTNQNVWAAVDIFNLGTGAAGAVGLGFDPTPTQTSAVPGPVVGAGLPGLIALASPSSAWPEDVAIGEPSRNHASSGNFSHVYLAAPCDGDPSGWIAS